MTEIENILLNNGFKLSDVEKGAWGYISSCGQKYAVILFDKAEQRNSGVALNYTKDLIEISADLCSPEEIKSAIKP